MACGLGLPRPSDRSGRLRPRRLDRSPHDPRGLGPRRAAADVGVAARHHLGRIRPSCSPADSRARLAPARERRARSLGRASALVAVAGRRRVPTRAAPVVGRCVTSSPDPIVGLGAASCAASRSARPGDAVTGATARSGAALPCTGHFGASAASWRPPRPTEPLQGQRSPLIPSACAGERRRRRRGAPFSSFS